MKPKVKPASEYLEQIGWGRYNQKVFIQCGAAWTTDMLWSANIAYILDGAKNDFRSTDVEIGVLGALFSLGLMVGAFLWGITGDRFGRMYAFKTTVSIAAVFSLILIFSVNQIMSGVLLFFLGFGLGGELTLGGTVFSEFCPPSKLHYLTRMTLFWSIGGTIAALVAFLTVLANNTKISSWRYICGVGFIIEIVCVFFRFYLEETPAFFQETGQGKKMEMVLNNISNENKSQDISFDTTQTENDTTERTNIENEPSTATLFKKLFNKENTKLVVLFTIVYSSAAFADTSILFFMPELLAGIGSVYSYGIILTQQALGLVGVVLSSWMVETRLGRKYTITVSFVSAGLCCFFFVVFRNIYSVRFRKVAVCTSVMNMFTMMGYSAIYTIMPESFPTEIRNIGVGISSFVARIAEVICPIFTGLVLHADNGFVIAVSVYIGLFGACAACSVFLRDTRNSVKAEG